MTTASEVLALVPVVNLPFLATEIADAHRQVKFHAKGMLLEAKRAGDALLRAKGMVPHGQFKAWVEGAAGLSHRTARVYMQVARAKSADLCHFEGSIAAFLDAHANHRKAPQPAPSFDPNDAEHALKLHALAERGSDGERNVARSKLSAFAKHRGMTAEEAVEKAKALLPDRELSPKATEVAAMTRELEALKAKVAVLEKKRQKAEANFQKNRQELGNLFRQATLGEVLDAFAASLAGMDWRNKCQNR